MIDIIIPTYNREDLIGRTLSSLVAQTDKNFNVIIVDDASTDNTQLVIKEFERFLNIIYLKNETNIGPGSSRQVGIDNSISKFVTFLDSDDMFMPYTVEAFNTAVKANPSTEMLCTFFYEHCNKDGDMNMILWKDNFTAMHGKLYNVEALRKYNIRFAPDLYFSEDAYFNAICTDLLEVTVLKIPTLIWVYNENSMLHCVDSERDKNKTQIFAKAIAMSSEFVKQYKSEVTHLENTLKKILQNADLSAADRVVINKLLEGGQN